MFRARVFYTILLLSVFSAGARHVYAQEAPGVGDESAVCPSNSEYPRVLLAGDSWAQYMWDDGTYNEVFDRFGHADKEMVSESEATNPGPGYTGTAYAISGSEAREWVDSANYPYLQNMLDVLVANPSIDTVVLSIGGNDVLAGRPDGGWYKDMDLDVPGLEAALFSRIYTDTFTIIGAALAIRPELNVMISSYDYPNFNTGGWCFLYACGKRADLSRDPVNDLISDEEINLMMVDVETRRINWANSAERVVYDNGMGLMHYFYGDGETGAGLLPYPGQEPPGYAPFPGGNPGRPSLRMNFRAAYDPIHLSADGYRHKISNQAASYFFPHFRGEPTETFVAQGGNRDGWTDGSTVGNGTIIAGDTGSSSIAGIISFDTSPIPDGAVIEAASLYLMRESAQGSNPFYSGVLGDPQLDVASGGFGTPDLEPGDLTAGATAANAGCAQGSVAGDGYALRVDLTAEGLAALDKTGLTQLRLSFPLADSGADQVSFFDGDAGATMTGTGFLGLAEVMGSAAPFLDVVYCSALEVDDLQITSAGDRLTLTWSLPSSEGNYDFELWQDSGDPYFTPGGSCAGQAACEETAATTFPASQPALGKALFYVIRARRGCGALAEPSNRVGLFNFPLHPGQ